ncbi:hypothetical protein TNCV_4447551 [Trichonephila clavipes]|nr:hypothetical protein TNCV_4447551 [Trichonephila clavipes]
MSPELSDEQRNKKLSNYSGNFLGFFTKTDKSTAAKTNVKHRIFTGDHAQSTNEPTESRRLKDASFMKRFRKCLMKSLLKSGVEFHWGPEEVEAFNSLKEAHLLRIQIVRDVRQKRASTEIHTDASGYGIGLS